MSTRPDTRLLAAAMMLENMAAKIQAVRAHVLAEKRILDGYPSGSDAPKVSHTAELTPVESFADRRLQLDLELADIEAGVRLLLVTVSDVTQCCDRLLGIRVGVVVDDTCTVMLPHPAKRDGERCEKVAIDHRMNDGSTVSGMCDDCWNALCSTCRIRPGTSKRSGKCEACYKRDWRSAAA